MIKKYWLTVVIGLVWFTFATYLTHSFAFGLVAAIAYIASAMLIHDIY